ncbi:pteridine reductase [Solilutibacter silvestris]|uniref:Dehydrogenase n=1 Tax=Solilutibacter silvestris TaxID=1645665 RepID=A0A2K1Q1K6_9GAMM|nr:pteridine reductase [Lysobacter silvestris]PNS08929.1 Dehydrogenase [Lysobacter silvestris]
MPVASPSPVVLVTGAARRIGAAIARHLHAQGYAIALHYRDSENDAIALRDTLEATRPGSTLLLQADLAQHDAAESLVARTVEHFGRLDGLVNNASTFFPTPIGSATQGQWSTLFDANARAPFFLAQAAAPHLRARQGSIVNITDIYGERPLRDHSAYCMCKAALLMMTRSLALELAPDVRVNAVAPGAILWPEHEVVDGARQAAIVARTPLARTGTPEDIAEAVYWLLASARFTTGEVVHVDGGRLLAN